MRKSFLALCMVLASMPCLTAGAHAADHTFETSAQPDYYAATAYEDYYHTRYSYGGPNRCDYDIPAIGYGLSQEFLEHSSHDPYQNPDFHRGVENTDFDIFPVPEPDGNVIELPLRPVITAEYLMQEDGSIGSVSIRRVGLACKVYEGTTGGTMDRGAGHYPGSGVWNGNIGLFGHNRGYGVAHFAGLKHVRLGDEVTYKSILGTKTYKVNFVGVIARTNFQYLNEMGDNRLTLITCVADQPTLRLCVQAAEIK